MNMKKIAYAITVSLFTLCYLGFMAVAQAQPATITSIGGYSDGVGVVNGRWTGQPARKPAGKGTDDYKGFLAVDTWEWSNASPSTWTIKGNGFGAKQGNVGLDPGFAGPLQISVMSILSWSNTEIRVRVAGDWRFTFYKNIKVTVRTATGAFATKTESIVATPRGRGYGQCTWEVFYQRKNAGLAPPTSAYPAATAIDLNYGPRQWDVLFWNKDHTAIITSIPQKTTTAGKTTYQFTITERNADWGEKQSVVGSSFAVQNGRVVQGILSKYSNTITVTTFWR